MRIALARAACVALAVMTTACSDSTRDATGDTTGDATAPTAVINPGDGGNYAVDIDPSRFTSVVDHPYMPKLPGTRWVYRSTAADGSVEIVNVEVLDERRTVMGVETIVVHDVVTTENDELIEDTYDWFAQDAEGNVWYFGEDTTAYDNGVASVEGAWEAGIGGALPGIVMPGSPAVSGIGYRQEFLAGEAEDMGEVIAVSGEVTVPVGTFDDVVVTRDWTPLTPETVEEKTYAQGIGFVRERKPIGPDAGEVVELVEFTPGR
jgi:hypothetical protein